MRNLCPLLVLSCSFFAFGCREEVKQPEPPAAKGLEIHVPGVDLTLDKEKGLQLRAGETEVKANRKEGVNVKAPGVDVDVDVNREKSGDQ